MPKVVENPMTGGMPENLPEMAVLKNHQNLRALCDIVVAEPPPGKGMEGWAHDPGLFAPLLNHLADLRDGAVVYIRSNVLDRFFAEAFPQIQARILLVTATGDWGTPGSHRRHLDDPRILRWFGENCDLGIPHPKYEAIPLAFADPHHPYGDQTVLMRVHRHMPPIREKPLTAHGSFHLRMSHPERHRVWEIVRHSPGVVLEPRRIPAELLWVHHANHAFAISPRGSGRDCHRTWEALMLRTIPIVMTSPLDPVYAGFPVVIVEDWREITPEAMARWRQERQDGFTASMFRRLTIDHWAERIRGAASEYRR
jgi:hypothetical protein